MIPRLFKLLPNFHEVLLSDGNVRSMYFSYETCVGFSAWGLGIIVSDNVWSSSTGKHINLLTGRKSQVSPEIFERLLSFIYHLNVEVDKDWHRYTDLMEEEGNPLYENIRLILKGHCLVGK